MNPIVITQQQLIHGLMCSLARLSGAEHEQQYMHGGCPECGIFYDLDYDWQHRAGCSRATKAEPARGPR